MKFFGILKHEVTGARLLNNKTGAISEIAISGFFVAIGHEPNTAIFKDFIHMDESGYIKTIPGSTKTNIEGVFACGDAQDHIYTARNCHAMPPHPAGYGRSTSRGIDRTI